MKKLVTIVILCLHSFSYAQTNTFPSSGNVGIGTSSPNTTLDVRGSVSLSIPSSTFSGIGSVDAQESIRSVNHFSTVSTPVSTISISSAAKWKVIFRGLWINNYEGGGLTQPGPYVELTSEFPSVNIGIITLTLSRDSGTGKIVGTTSSYVEQKDIGFSGIIDIISNNFTAAGTTSMSLKGNLGIGISTPSEKLEIYRDGTVYSSINGGSNVNSTTGLLFKNNAGSSQANISSYQGNLNFYVGPTSSSVNAATILPNGNFGIGTSTPAEKLSVNGNIRSKEVKVETINWPDYVFEPSYKLPSLNETEKFIKANQHLPGIPSAKEAEKDGINLGEMNSKLLQKIEELTLYIINQNKRIEQLETTINKP